MISSLEIAPEVEKTVRRVLFEWAASMPRHPYGDFSKAVVLNSVSEKPTFIVNLHTLYDVRGDPVQCVKPYSEALAGAYQPASPDSMDVWKESAPLNMEFMGQEADVGISTSFESIHCPKCEEGKATCMQCPGTGSAECKQCEGRGRTPCKQCGGRGKLPCTHCRGRGKVPKSLSGTRAEETVCSNCNGEGGWPCESCEKGSFPCKACHGQGRFKCAECKGEGIASCKECQGHGKILKGFQVHVRYAPYFSRRVVHDPSVPAGFFPAELPFKRMGERVCEKQGSILTMDALSQANLKSPLGELLKEAEQGKTKFESSPKIIKQEVFVEKIPVYLVNYRFRNKDYECWLTPMGDRVFAEETPFKELALSWVKEGGEQMRHHNFGHAQALLSQAEALSGGDPAILAAARDLQSDQMKEFDRWNLLGSVAAAVIGALLVGFLNRHTHHLFGPLFIFLVLSIGGGVGLGRWVRSKQETWLKDYSQRIAILALSATAPAVLMMILFAWSSPMVAADRREFSRMMASRFGPEMPDSLTPPDQEYLRQLIAVYEPIGVNVEAAKTALAVQALVEEKARQQKLEAERRERLRKQRLEAEKRKKTREEVRKKAEQEKKKKAQSSKKKKKWFPWGKSK